VWVLAIRAGTEDGFSEVGTQNLPLSGVCRRNNVRVSSVLKWSYKLTEQYEKVLVDLKGAVEAVRKCVQQLLLE